MSDVLKIGVLHRHAVLDNSVLYMLVYPHEESAN